MDKFYIKNNLESTKDAFNKKQIYKNTVKNLNGGNHNNVINFNIGEKVLYGRIKRNGIPICMIERQNLSAIKNVADPEKNPLHAMHFVAEVFDEMCLQFEKCAQSGQIRNDSEFLTNLKAYKAYTNPIEHYNRYRQIYDNRLAGLFKRNNYRPENFTEFIMHLESVLKFVSRDARFTLPGYIKSKTNSIMTTGVAIEVANKVKYSNDNKKIEKFIMDPNWNFFVQTCDSYGFMIDMNIPWRIVADLDSKIMKSRSGKYGLNNVTSMLDGYYKAAHTTHILSFAEDLLELYNTVKTDRIQKFYTCYDGHNIGNSGNVKSYYVTPRSYTALGLLEEYGAQFLLRVYAILRIHEEIPEAPEATRKKLLDEMAAFSKVKKAGVIESFEILINKEFDKINSFSYLNRANKTKQISKFESGEINAISSY
tara:strand:+ start:232 stop:1500 length:1269 start_codon:yes stop_codon:yes gene_type:complete